MGELRTVLLEGIFYEDGDEILVQTDMHPKPVVVREALAPMIDLKVNLAAHHFPVEPLDEHRWGGGCCLWESAGTCPAGHHKDPSYLFNVFGEGVLCYDPIKGWAVEGRPIDLRMLAGHRSRLVSVVQFDLSELRDTLGQLDPTDLNRAAQMKDTLTKLQEFLRGMRAI